MSVQIKYNGRMGNTLCQYVAARLFAEKLGLQLDSAMDDRYACGFFHTQRSDQLLRTTEPKSGLCNHPERDYRPLTDLPTDRTFIEAAVNGVYEFEGAGDTGAYTLDGYFDNAALFKDRERIKQFFVLPEYEPKPAQFKSVALCMRLTDMAWYRGGRVVNPKWWARAVKLAGMDDATNFDIYCDEFNATYFNAVIDAIGSHREFQVYAATPVPPFHEIARYKHVIVSNTSFAWWAAFLGNAEKIHTYGWWTQRPGGSLPSLAYGSEHVLPLYPDLEEAAYWTYEYLVQDREFLGHLADKAMEIEGWTLHPELIELGSWARRLQKDHRVVEVGAYKGRSTVMLAESTSNPIYVFDPFEEGFTQKEMVIDRSVYEEFLKNISVYCNVHHRNQPADNIFDRSVGLLFIDGNHEYPHPKNDFLAFKRGLAPNAVVAFHDFGAWPGVTRSVLELRGEGWIKQMRLVNNLWVGRVGK